VVRRVQRGLRHPGPAPRRRARARPGARCPASGGSAAWSRPLASMARLCRAGRAASARAFQNTSVRQRRSAARAMNCTAPPAAAGTRGSRPCQRQPVRAQRIGAGATAGARGATASRMRVQHRLRVRGVAVQGLRHARGQQAHAGGAEVELHRHVHGGGCRGVEEGGGQAVRGLLGRRPTAAAPCPRRRARRSRSPRHPLPWRGRASRCPPAGRCSQGVVPHRRPAPARAVHEGGAVVAAKSLQRERAIQPSP
jgi:hypothetical protein